MTGSASGRYVVAVSFALTFLILVANGRAIGSGDTNTVERTAAALAENHSFVLPLGEPLDPFTRATPGGRISIYPPLTAILAAPFFWIFSLFFDLNPSGIQAAGKLVAALFAATATAIMAQTFARRVAPPRALLSALLFGIGTSVFSTAQALWQHPTVLLFMAIALSMLDRVFALPRTESLRPALIAALSLSLVAAARPSCIPMCAVLFVVLLREARANAQWLITIACVPAAAVALYNQAFFGAPWRFGPSLGGRFFDAFPDSIAGLLLSPARGLLIFTPVAAIAALGLFRAARVSAFARGLMAAVSAHFLFIATWNEWHGGESFGPRLLTDMLPPLLFLLPEALSAWPVLAAVLGLCSVAVQLVGGWTYDYRWERLHQRGRAFDAALWSWSESPLPFALREGVVIQGMPDVDGRRLRLQSRRFVPFGPQGSSIEAGGVGLRITGDPRLRDIRLERGARVGPAQISLTHPADALAFRVVSAGSLSLSVIGTLQGTLRVETSAGTQSIPTSGGFDLTVSVEAAANDDVFIRAESGELKLTRVEKIKP